LWIQLIDTPLRIAADQYAIGVTSRLEVLGDRRRADIEAAGNFTRAQRSACEQFENGPAVGSARTDRLCTSGIW
jgi:hypothetical protein